MARQWVIAVGVFLGVLFGGSVQLSGQSATLSPALPVTQGLIRWWPNVFDAQDVVTGQSGVLMGLFPPATAGDPDPAQFGWESGWAQLRPAITNSVFTVCFWMCPTPERLLPNLAVLGQQSGTNSWFFTSANAGHHFTISREKASSESQYFGVPAPPGVWSHWALARRSDGSSTIWLNGKRVSESGPALAWAGDSDWLMVGNNTKGELSFRGNLQDLCAFDRVLQDDEVAQFHLAGFPNRPALNTPARAAATISPPPITHSTNVNRVPTTTWQHQKFTTEEGLPGNIVQALLESKQGYLWIGTEDGLARYDGRRFRSFTQQNTEAMEKTGHDILCLAEEATGTLWAGTFGGLLRVRGTEITAFTNGLPERFIQRIAPADDGSLWIFGFHHHSPRGTGVLRRYYPETGSSSVAVPIPGQMRQMTTASNGLWLATQQPEQVLFWDGRASTPTVVARVSGWPEPIRVQAGMANAASVRTWESVNKSVTNRWAELHLGTNQPVFRWHWNSEPPWGVNGRWQVSPMSQDWVATDSILGRYHDGLIETFIDDTHRRGAPSIVCVHAGREGGLWYGTEEDGLHLIQERLIRMYTTDGGLPGNEVRSVAVDSQGTVWVATSEGMARIDQGRARPHLTGPINTVALRPHELPWFGSAEGGTHALHRSSDTTAIETVIVDFAWNDPNTLRFARDGKLWVTSRRHVAWLKPDHFTQGSGSSWKINRTLDGAAYRRFTVGEDLPETGLVGLVEGQDGSMWVGTLGAGVIRLIPDPDKAGGYLVQTNTVSDGLPGNMCSPVLCDDSGAVWFTCGPALARFKDTSFQVIQEKDGLPDDLMLDAIEDDLGSFWFSGKKGLHRIPRRELEEFFDGKIRRVKPQSLGARDGLLTPECSSLYYPTMAKTPDGHIWVATRDGLATFDPRQMHLNVRPLPAIIESFSVNRIETALTRSTAVPSGVPKLSPVSPGPVDLLRLPAGSGQRIEIEFTAVSLTGADRVRFQHRLDGHDSYWSPPSDLRHAFYTNLRPGAYTFRVRAANRHGIWNDSETAVEFLIRPYFWQTSALYIAIVVLIGGASVLWHWRRVRVLQRVEDLKHQEALAAERARIAADMHDELGAALTQIAILGEVAKTQLNNREQAQRSLSRISQSARNVASGISDLVWATNPRHETLDNLAAYLRENVARQFEYSAICTQLDFPSYLPDIRLSATLRRNVLLVTKEAINNIIKHSRATVASVQLEVEPDYLLVRIADNGSGFDPDHLKRPGNGLGNMQRRVTDLGGEFNLKSTPGVGTTLNFRVAISQPK